MKPHDVNAIAHSIGLGVPGIPTHLSPRPKWPADLPPCRMSAAGLCNMSGCRGCDARRAWLARGAAMRRGPVAKLHHDSGHRSLFRGQERAWATCGRIVRLGCVTSDTGAVDCEQCRRRTAFKAVAGEVKR